MIGVEQNSTPWALFVRKFCLVVFCLDTLSGEKLKRHRLKKLEYTSKALLCLIMKPVHRKYEVTVTVSIDGGIESMAGFIELRVLHI
jgi:hypothetical protein